MRKLMLSFVFLFCGTWALADVSQERMAQELRGWFTDFTLLNIIDTKTSDDGESVVAYLELVLNSSAKLVPGTVTFVKMDSGSWYLMHFTAETGGLGGARLHNIVRRVQIE